MLPRGPSEDTGGHGPGEHNPGVPGRGSVLCGAGGVERDLSPLRLSSEKTKIPVFICLLKTLTLQF